MDPGIKRAMLKDYASFKPRQFPITRCVTLLSDCCIVLEDYTVQALREPFFIAVIRQKASIAGFEEAFSRCKCGSPVEKEIFLSKVGKGFY